MERDRDFDHRNRRSGQLDGSPPPKRKAEAKSVFSRLSGPPSSKDDEKPKLNSRIIRELPTKEEIVEAQGSDPASRARNRRMFGSLMGTLQKFCQEESRLRNKEEKKAKIERKLEEQQNQEREIMKKERQNLYNNRKRQQLEIKMLEHKMNVMKEFTTFEEAKKPLMNFIRTKNKPYIYYLPKVLDKQTESKLADSKRDIQSEWKLLVKRGPCLVSNFNFVIFTEQIDRRQEEVKKELNEIVSRFENSFEALHSNDVHSDDETNHNLSLKSAVNASTANNNENDDKRSHRDDEDDVDEDHIIHEAKTDNHKNDKSKENKKTNVNKGKM